MFVLPNLEVNWEANTHLLFKIVSSTSWEEAYYLEDRWTTVKYPVSLWTRGELLITDLLNMCLSGQIISKTRATCFLTSLNKCRQGSEVRSRGAIPETL